MADLGDVLTLAKAKDSSAFAGLVRAHQSMVYSAAYHFLRNEAWAEEIAQDVFLDLFRSLDAIASPEHLRAWLRRSTLCRCIDVSRRAPYRQEVPLLEYATPGGEGGPPDVFAMEWLRDQVATLPEQQRAAIILRYQEEMDPSEIATALDLPVNTVKSRLHRGLETLRNRLGKAARAVV